MKRLFALILALVMCFTLFACGSNESEKQNINSKYTTLHFDGSELDPCGFLDKHSAFDKKPEYYIKDLKEGDDYKEETYSPEGFAAFSMYTLYPEFEYMGIEKGHTSIELGKDSEEEYIGVVSYKFLLGKENAADRMNYIYSKLTEEYGAAVNSIYTPYSGMGVTDLSFDEMVKKIAANAEGIYNVQWENDSFGSTLSLTISADAEDYEGSVAFTN